jgi:hypothetical protein
MSDLNLILYEFVLEAVANDYESFECILKQVMQWATGQVLNVAREEVAEALRRAIREGDVQAFLLSPQPPYSQTVEFSPDRLDDLWFYVTPKGKRLVAQF